MGSWVINPADPGGVQVNNNVWNQVSGWSQTLYACSASNWSVVAKQPGSGNNDGVKSYPDTQYHVSMPVSSMTTLPSSWKVNVPSSVGSTSGIGEQWNSDYDLWLADDATYGTRWATEVMIWGSWNANYKYWYDQLGGEQVTIDGVSYSAYHRASPRGIWFIRNTPVSAGEVDIAHLLKWAVGKGWMPATSILHEIENGFELLYTNARFDLLDFTLTMPSSARIQGTDKSALRQQQDRELEKKARALRQKAEESDREKAARAERRPSIPSR